MRLNAPNSAPLVPLQTALVLVFAACLLVPSLHAGTRHDARTRLHAEARRTPARTAESAKKSHQPAHAAKPEAHRAEARQVARHTPSKRTEPKSKTHEEHDAAKRTAAPAKAAGPVPEPAAEPEPHVTHDRKIHYGAIEAGSAPASDTPDAPRKATIADFLTPFPAATTKHEAKPASQPAPTTVPSQPPAPIVRQYPAHLPLDAWGFEPLPAAPQAAPPTTAKPAARPTDQVKAAVAAPPIPLPTLYSRNGRLILPPPLKGSREILLHQNEVADREGLDRIQDDADLEHMRAAHLLVPIPVGKGILVDERLPMNRRYTRPWTAKFLADLGRAYYARFHDPLQINSAVRTVEFQQRLIEVNGNAAPAEGDTASPHLTGQAVDLAKHGLSITEIAWMRAYLLPLVQQGKVDVEEEFQQSCFHISVYKSYLPPAAPRRRSSAAALATAMR